MSGIYGEMENTSKFSNLMFNLIISQILDSQTKGKFNNISKRSKLGEHKTDKIASKADASVDKIESGGPNEDLLMYEKLIE